MKQTKRAGKRGEEMIRRRGGRERTRKRRMYGA